MFITNRSIISFVLVALAGAAGCNETIPSESPVAERAEPASTILAATAPPAPLESIRPSEKMAATVSKPVDAPVVETAEAESPSPYELDGIAIRRLITAPKVEHREPVAPTSVFAPDETEIYAFVEVSNESEVDKFLWVHFIGPDGQVSGGVELTIPAGAPRWRTWARTKHATHPGLWRVEIRTGDGDLLGALPFEVDPGC